MVLGVSLEFFSLKIKLIIFLNHNLITECLVTEKCKANNNNHHKITYATITGLTFESLALLEGVKLIYFHNSCLFYAFVRLLAESVAQ